MELQSEKIDEITKAMVKAQFEMQGAKKGNKNPFFKSSYADLTEIITTLKEPFNNNNLCFFQSTLPGENGTTIIVTTIAHESGQWIRSYTPMKPTKNDPQANGSAITYGRRYGLQALSGIPAIDDDGNAASTKPKKQANQKTYERNEKPLKPFKDARLIEAKKDFPKIYDDMIKTYGGEPVTKEAADEAMRYINQCVEISDNKIN